MTASSAPVSATQTPWLALREVVTDMRAGGTPKRSEPSYWGSDIPFVKIEDLTRATDGYIRSTLTGITEDGLRNSSAHVLPPGNVLLSMYASIGAVAINKIPVATNQAIIALQPDDRVVDANYLAYALQFLAPQLQAMNVQTTQKNVNAGIVAGFKIPVPPLADQRVIAGRLAVAQQLQSRALKTCSISDALRLALIGKLVGDAVPGAAAVRLADVAKVGNGSTPKRDDERYWLGGTFPWLTSGKVHERRIVAATEFVTETALAECHLPVVQADSVLVAITGQGKTLGNVALLGIDACINQHLAYITPDATQLTAAFLAYSLTLEYHRFREVAFGGGSTKGALTCSYIGSLQVAIPPLEVQHVVVAALRATDRNVNAQRSYSAASAEIFQSMLSTLIGSL